MTTFGHILSCKVAQDDEGNSKCYAFVQFECEESANNAILAVNGTYLSGKKVFVGPFVPKEDRKASKAMRELNLTNVFVKNLSEECDDNNKLRKLFEPFGKVYSAKVMFDEQNKCKGYGFVSFERAEMAQKACDELNGMQLSNGKTLYVGRHQRKAERQALLTRKFEQLST